MIYQTSKSGVQFRRYVPDYHLMQDLQELLNIDGNYLLVHTTCMYVYVCIRVCVYTCCVCVCVCTCMCVHVH